MVTVITSISYIFKHSGGGVAGFCQWPMLLHKKKPTDKPQNLT